MDNLSKVLSAKYFIEISEKGKVLKRVEAENALNNGMLALLQGARMQFERPDAAFSPISGFSTSAASNFDGLQSIGCYDSADFPDALPTDLGEVTRHPAKPRGVVASAVISGAPYGAYTTTKSQATLNKITKVGTFTANADFMLTHLSGFKGTDVTVPADSALKQLLILGNYQTITLPYATITSTALCVSDKIIGVVVKSAYTTASGTMMLFRWDEATGAVTYLKSISGYACVFTDGTHLYGLNTTTSSIDRLDTAGTVVQSTPVSSYSSIPLASAAVVCQTVTDVWITNKTNLVKVTLATGAVQVYTPTWTSAISSITQNQLVSDGTGKHIYINGYAFKMSDFLTGVITPVYTTGTTLLIVGATGAVCTKLKDNLWVSFVPSTTTYYLRLQAPVQEIGSFAALSTPIEVFSGQDVTLGYTITYNEVL